MTAALIEKWANYCRAFGIPPTSLIGRRYPAHEEQVMDAETARAVEALLRSAEQTGQTIRAE